MFLATRRSVHFFNINSLTQYVLSSKTYYRSKKLSSLNSISHSSNRFFSDKKDDEKWKDYSNTALSLRTFDAQQKKEKDNYLECLRQYEGQTGRKSDCVEFLYAALKYMDEFGVQKDLECYKKLLNTFPKGKMIPTNRIQAEFMHYPKEQKCATYILEKMENNRVIPDIEVERILRNVFGKDSTPMHKLWRMMYWMPKFKNINPWPLPSPLPNEALELAKLAIYKISSVDIQAKITIFQTDTVKDSIDKTWIVSAITPKQKELLENHRPRTKAVYVEGPFTVWVADRAVDYFVLLSKTPKEEKMKIPEVDFDDVSNLDISYWKLNKTSVIAYPSVHEQIHETIFSVCATGTSSKDSVLSWIRCLQKENPVLSKLHIIFTLRQKSETGTKLLEGSPEAESQKNHQEEIHDR